MSWCERERVGYVFGLAGNKVLLRRVTGLAEEAAVSRIEEAANKVRRFSEFAYAAKTWNTERRVIARVEASDKGADSRFRTLVPSTMCASQSIRPAASVMRRSSARMRSHNPALVQR
jgi:hypothetical protein